MSDAARRTYVLRAPAAVLVFGAIAAPGLGAQQLPLKTAIPPGEALICGEAVGEASPPAPVQGDADGAVRLVNAATQTMLLGDLDGALEFLDHALHLDPAAADAVYLKARIFQRQEAPDSAAAALCQFLRIDPVGPSAQEARQRLDAARDEGVGRELLDAYRNALELERQGHLVEAEAALSRFVAERPAAAVAVYNRAVVRLALGQDDGAHSDLRRYLALEPDAPDASQVWRVLGPGPSASVAWRPGTAFITGVLLPGGGQFYTGRPLVGAAITTLAGGALAAGILSERTTIRCRDAQATVCAEDWIASRDTERPWLLPAVGAAMGLALGAAMEATLYVRRAAGSAHHEPSVIPGPARLLPLDGVRPHGSALRLELIRLHF
jgi:tetratricopeptide (TPR) repeat protein